MCTKRQKGDELRYVKGHDDVTLRKGVVQKGECGKGQCDVEGCNVMYDEGP